MSEVELKVLPDIPFDQVCNRELLQALASTGNEETLATDTVGAIIAVAWQQTRRRIVAEILLSGINVVLLCYVSAAFRFNRLPLKWEALYILIFFHVKMTLEEASQQFEFLVRRLKSFWRLLHQNEDNASSWKQVEELAPFLDLDQLTDFGYQILGCVALGRQVFGLFDDIDPDFDGDELERPFMAVFSAMAWVRFCYSLRGEPWMGPRVLPILSALQDTVSFFFLTAIALCAATHAYYNLQTREGKSALYQAFLQTVRLGALSAKRIQIPDSLYSFKLRTLWRLRPLRVRERRAEYDPAGHLD